MNPQNLRRESRRGQAPIKPGLLQSAIRCSLGVLAIGTLAACGGGADSGSGIGVADGGIRGTGSSVGPVSGFGSVFVNGVRFDTSDLNGQVQGDDGITTEGTMGKIILMHLGTERKEDFPHLELTSLIKELRLRDYQFVKVSDLLKK